MMISNGRIVWGNQWDGIKINNTTQHKRDGVNLHDDHRRMKAVL